MTGTLLRRKTINNQDENLIDGSHHFDQDLAKKFMLDVATLVESKIKQVVDRYEEHYNPHIGMKDEIVGAAAFLAYNSKHKDSYSGHISIRNSDLSRRLLVIVEKLINDKEYMERFSDQYTKQRNLGKLCKLLRTKWLKHHD